MKGNRYSQEFKEDAVWHWIKSGKSADEVARGLGVTTWSLRRWRMQLVHEMDGNAAAGAEMKPSEMEAEIRRLPCSDRASGCSGLKEAASLSWQPPFHQQRAGLASWFRGRSRLAVPRAGPAPDLRRVRTSPGWPDGLS
jgi:transposase-like protein